MVDGGRGHQDDMAQGKVSTHKYLPFPASNSFQGPGEEGEKEGEEPWIRSSRTSCKQQKVGGIERTSVGRCLLARFRSSLLCLSACMQQAPHAALGGWMPASVRGS